MRISVNVEHAFIADSERRLDPRQCHVSGGGASANMSTLRTVKEPIDALHIDWQAYKSTSTYGLYGYYSTTPPSAPNPPTLTSPVSGSVVPLVATNLVLAWTFTSPVTGDTQTGAYVRRQLAGSGYQWWTGAAWTAQQAGATGGAEVAVTALTTAMTVTTGTWVAADVYSYSVQAIGGPGYSPAMPRRYRSRLPTRRRRRRR